MFIHLLEMINTYYIDTDNEDITSLLGLLKHLTSDLVFIPQFEGKPTAIGSKNNYKELMFKMWFGDTFNVPANDTRDCSQTMYRIMIAERRVRTKLEVELKNKRVGRLRVNFGYMDYLPIVSVTNTGESARVKVGVHVNIYLSIVDSNI